MKYHNVLLIDNDLDDCELFVMAVKDISESATCIISQDASKALKSLDDGIIVPAVIFLDLNMPVMNGQQFLIAIKAHPLLNQIPVIIFSTLSHPATVQRMIELGAEDFITKPDDYGQLLEMLTPYVY